MRNKYTKENLENAIKTNVSMAGVMRYFGVKPSGGTHYYLKNKAIEWKIDMSHFTGQAHLKGKTHNWSHKTPINEFLIKHSKCSRGNLKYRLIKENILINECSICKQQSFWNNKPLIMILDHINGVNDDNRKENLRLICPNCNTQQLTFCGKNLIKVSNEEILKIIKEFGIEIGSKKLNLTKNGVRYRLKQMKNINN
jgi:RNA polymerase subunit RPABC4/transcription elongation factor Spt4